MQRISNAAAVAPPEVVYRQRVDLIAMKSLPTIWTAGEYAMASITIRNLDDSITHRLRIRAAEQGRSIEEEARDILRHVVGAGRPAHNLAAPIRARVVPTGGADLDLPPHEPMREPSAFDRPSK